MKLLVGITCTDKDFKVNHSRLRLSVENFLDVFSNNVQFLLFLQTNDRIDSFVDKFVEDYKSSLVVVKSDIFSVSHARNVIIDYAVTGGFDNFIFHDSSVIFVKQYLQWVAERGGRNLIYTDFSYTNEVSVTECVPEKRVVHFSPFKHSYVCGYIFPVTADLGLFNLDFGPGYNTRYKCGEDFLFLWDFFEHRADSKSIIYYKGIGLVHPPRPTDYSKQATYAFGQGKIHKIFLLKEKSLYAFWRCLLFFGNALLKSLSLRPGWFVIFKDRIRGFLD